MSHGSARARMGHGLSLLHPELAADLARALGDPSELPGGLLHTDLLLVRDLAGLAALPGRAAPPELELLVLTLLVARDEGSLCIALTEESLGRRVAALLGDDADAVRAWVARTLGWLRNGEEARWILGSPANDRFPLIRYERGTMAYLYFQRHFVHERDVMERLEARRSEASASPLAPREAVAAALREVLIERPETGMDGEPRRLNARQALAVALGLTRRFVVVSGGPGTGKTSIVTALLRCLVRLDVAPEEIALTAPTGRAAQRLGESLRKGLRSAGQPTEAEAGLDRVEGSTLHRLLGYNPRTGAFGRHRGDPLRARVVVVDESSMVDVELMQRLLEALEPEATLLLLGDRDQLPSVEAGAVLASLLPTEDDAMRPAETAAAALLTEAGLALPEGEGGAIGAVDGVVVLRENYRSRGAIREVADRVRAGQDSAEVVEAVPVCDPAGLAALWGDPAFAGCYRAPADGLGVREWEQVLDGWALAHFGPDYTRRVRAAGRLRLDAASLPDAAGRELLAGLLATVERARLLTLVREGPYGCVGANRYLCGALARELEPGGSPAAFSGMPLLVTRNLPLLGLWNGDVGLLVRDGERRLRAVFAREGDVRLVSLASIAAWEPAFAITVHKSQGSEYDRVLVAVPPEGARRLLSREMIYTAITRARSLAVVYACREPLVAALATRVERESGMAWGA